MTPVAIPFRFRVGERTLLTVRRRLVRLSFDLESALSGSAVSLPQLPAGADGYFLASVPVNAALPPFAGLRFERDRYPRYFAEMAGTMDGYLAKLSGNTRSMLKRRLRRFEELSGGAVDVRVYRTPAEMIEFQALARAVSAKTYQERRLGAGLPEDVGPMLGLAATDSCRGYLLFANGQPVAYLYTPIERDVLIYAYLGYDPAWREHSPGMVLQLEAMRSMFAEQRFRYFDFTEGEGQHKRQLSTGSVECADVVLLRPSTANRALVKSLGAFNAGVARLRGIAERMGLKSKLRGLLRG